MDRAITSVIDGLIPSIIYTAINRLINLINNRINTLIDDFAPDGGNSTLMLKEYRINDMEFMMLEKIFIYKIGSF